jgi:hypothetical protein
MYICITPEYEVFSNNGLELTYSFIKLLKNGRDADFSCMKYAARHCTGHDGQYFLYFRVTFHPLRKREVVT